MWGEGGGGVGGEGRVINVHMIAVPCFDNRAMNIVLTFVGLERQTEASSCKKQEHITAASIKEYRYFTGYGKSIYGHPSTHLHDITTTRQDCQVILSRPLSSWMALSACLNETMTRSAVSHKNRTNHSLSMSSTPNSKVNLCFNKIRKFFSELHFMK